MTVGATNNRIPSTPDSRDRRTSDIPQGGTMHQITYQLALARQDELLGQAAGRRRATTAQTRADATNDTQMEAAQPSRLRTTVARIRLVVGGP
jgi:hypothetical protein